MSDYLGFARFLRRFAGGAAGAPATLGSGQGFVNEGENGGVLYYGAGDDGTKKATSVIKLGGVGAFVDLASAQTIPGRKTFGTSPVVPTPAAGDSSTNAASTAFVTAAVAGVSGSALTAGPGIQISGGQVSIPGYGSVAVGSLLKVTSSGLAAAVAGTDFVAPFSAIDPGTA